MDDGHRDSVFKEYTMWKVSEESHGNSSSLLHLGAREACRGSEEEHAKHAVCTAETSTT